MIMSIDARAGLFYGYCWDEEIDLFGEDADGNELIEWEEVVCRRRGLPDDWATRQAVGKEFGVTLGSHGVDGWRMPYLYIDDHRHWVEAGTPLDVSALGLAVAPEWDAALERWFEATGVSKPHASPRWWLVAWC
jgi:hypothetical protein